MKLNDHSLNLCPYFFWDWALHSWDWLAKQLQKESIKLKLSLILYRRSILHMSNHKFVIKVTSHRKKKISFGFFILWIDFTRYIYDITFNKYVLLSFNDILSIWLFIILMSESVVRFHIYLNNYKGSQEWNGIWSTMRCGNIFISFRSVGNGYYANLYRWVLHCYHILL